MPVLGLGVWQMAAVQAAHQGTDRLQSVPQLTLKQGLRAPRLKLWDERRGRLVTFREARA